jgi:hypothetical protein
MIKNASNTPPIHDEAMLDPERYWLAILAAITTPVHR